jgi:hypothetical protein
LCLRNVPSVKDVRTECPNLVTACEKVDVAHVIWFENNNDRRSAGVESSPNIGGIVCRRERVKKHNLST